MQVCNSCRYCEGYCAVFPAMELRRKFSNEDLAYLANLCHNCRGCLYACPYAPPHEFELNLPKIFAEVRMQTYAEYAWPSGFGKAFEKNGVLISVLVAISLAGVFLLTSLAGTNVFLEKQVGPGAFYRVISFRVMATTALVTFGYALLALFMGFLNFQRDAARQLPRPKLADVFRAIKDVLTLKNLGGGGHGCNDLDDSFSNSRRRFHHALFYGFVLCSISTSVAAVYDHFLNWVAPYPLLSLPVVFGTIGGIGMVVGCGGLFWLKLVGDQTASAKNLLGSEVALLVLLAASALTGILLLAFRSTAAMGGLLALHLGFILALFITLPYSRFVHGVYRSAALLSNAAERRTAVPVHLE